MVVEEMKKEQAIKDTFTKHAKTVNTLIENQKILVKRVEELEKKNDIKPAEPKKEEPKKEKKEEKKEEPKKEDK